MVLTIYDDNSVGVSMCTTHYGHDLSLGHIRLSKNTSSPFAAKLALGVTYQRILDDIREQSGKRSRLHLTTCQDIRNVERCFGLNISQKHKNDAVSVEIWVHEMKNIPNKSRASLQASRM